MVKDHDPIARLVLSHALSYRGHNAGGFVPEDARGGVRAGGNLLQVSAADAAGMHSDEQLARADGGDGHGFQADVIAAAIDSGQHVRGQGSSSRLVDLSCNSGFQESFYLRG
jgi:hypothetical protein